MGSNRTEPDIKPLRLSSIDIISLDNIEIRAVLVHLAGHEDPVVAEAVVEAVHKVLGRTRAGPPALPLPSSPNATCR